MSGSTFPSPSQDETKSDSTDSNQIIQLTTPHHQNINTVDNQNHIDSETKEDPQTNKPAPTIAISNGITDVNKPENSDNNNNSNREISDGTIDKPLHSVTDISRPSLPEISVPHPCPQQVALDRWYIPTNLLSLLTFSWLTPLIRKGAAHPLQLDDVWDTFHAEHGDQCWSAFEPCWEKTQQAAKAKNQPPRLLNAFTRMIGWQFVFGCLLFSWSVADTLLGPQFLNQLVSYSVASSIDPSIPVWEGYKWVVMMFISASGAALARSAGMHVATRLFLRVRNVTIIAIYRKSLRISGKNRHDGAVNNLMASDTQKVADLAQQIHNLWSAPIILAIGVYELYQQVQWSALIGLAVMVIFFPIAGALTAKQVKYQKLAAGETDKRITLINEFILGIRVVKYYAWEKPFLNVLDEQRERELEHLKTYVYLKSITFGILLLVPLLVSVVVFGIYVATGGVMSPTVVFTTVSLINVIRMPFTFLPIAISQCVQTLVAFSRIEKFLVTPEIDTEARLKLPHVGIEMKAAQFTWESSEEEAADGKKKGEEKDKGKGTKSKKKDVKKESSKKEEKKEKQQKKESVLEKVEENVHSKGITIATDDPGTFAKAKREELMLEADMVAEAAATASGGTQKPSQEISGMVNKVQGSVLNLNPASAANLNAATKSSSSVDLHDVYENKDAGRPVDEKEKEEEVKVQRPRLTNISLSSKAGDLVLVIGPVGCGKTTLLYGLLGEVEQSAGSTAVGGRVAYLPQTAFIINASVRDNVIFGSKFNKKRYDAVIEACALTADLAVLSNGDLTEIGERGINLSGGQKQRIQLARAAYQESDIVLLDDPLSAVDMHVSRHIFTHCINGIMKKRLRVLVTHSMAYVDEADNILLMKEADHEDTFTVVQGTAAELREKDGDFRSLLSTYHRGKDTVTNDDGTVKKLKGKKLSEAAKTEDPKKKTLTALEEEQKKKRGVLMEEEEREQGDVDWLVYKSYIVAGGSLFYFIVLPICFAGTQACQTAGDFWLARWSNSLGNSLLSTGAMLGVYGAFVFSTTLSTLARTTCNGLFGLRASRTLHHNLGHSILAKSISWYDRTPGGRIINRFTKDMFSIDIMISLMNEFAIATGLQVLGVLIVISIIVPLMLAVFLPLAIIYYILTKYYRKTNTELQRLESISRTPLFTHFAETLGGTVTIRALKVQDMYILENVRRTDTNTRAFYFSKTVNFWLRVRLDFMGAVILGTCGAFAVGNVGGTVSPGNFGLLISYALSMSNALNMAVILAAMIEAMMNSVERVLYYSVNRDYEKWDATNKELSKSVQGGIWPRKGKIVIENLQLRYRADLDLVLKGISLTINPGQRVGIVGRTGSGKSSLLVALFRMVEPCGGSILIDNVNIQHISLVDLRSNISIIPQDAILFYGSLRYNLDPFHQYSDEAIWESLSYVQLSAVIGRMPKKLETQVAEAGSNLSAGQRQLLCLARALLRRPRVVCLDEATANVDIETDDLIQKVIREQFATSTILTIAHRLNTILDYDKVLVMDQGLVAEWDSPDVLRRKEGGIFSSMLQSSTASSQTDTE